MFKNKFYSSFTAIIISDPDTVLELEDFQAHNWPHDIKVYKGREPDDQQRV